MWIRSKFEAIGIAIYIAAMLGLLWGLLQPAPAMSAEPPERDLILANLLSTTQEIMHLEGAPAFVQMTTQQMKEDGCANPEKCPTLVSIHPPGAKHIIVNSDVDITDLNAQGQIVHVIVMYLVEQAGGYSPDMPCDRVMQIEAHAQVVQAVFMDLRMQAYMRAGQQVPEFVKHQVITFCTPPAVKGEF